MPERSVSPLSRRSYRHRTPFYTGFALVALALSPVWVVVLLAIAGGWLNG
jgi:hypothetical protein